jgi:hypothetical protein
MNKLVLAIVVVTLFGFLGCNTEGGKSQSNISNGMELSVEPGEHWNGKMKILIFSISTTPQMAAWIEDNQGNYISTITVTNKGAKKNWMGAPKEGRPEALPVWYHKIPNNMTQIDSVSAATTKGAVDIQIDRDSLINGQEYNVYLEINLSFDYNDIWPEKKNDVNGQPSLIYRANFIAGTIGRIKLDPVGHGSAGGSDGYIVNGLDGMTTALTIIKDAYIIIH